MNIYDLLTQIISLLTFLYIIELLIKQEKISKDFYSTEIGFKIFIEEQKTKRIKYQSKYGKKKEGKK